MHAHTYMQSSVNKVTASVFIVFDVDGICMTAVYLWLLYFSDWSCLCSLPWWAVHFHWMRWWSCACFQRKNPQLSRHPSSASSSWCRCISWSFAKVTCPCLYTATSFCEWNRISLVTLTISLWFTWTTNKIYSFFACWKKYFMFLLLCIIGLWSCVRCILIVISAMWRRQIILGFQIRLLYSTMTWTTDWAVFIMTTVCTYGTSLTYGKWRKLARFSFTVVPSGEWM